MARDRLEMVFLSDAGWSPPRIAGHLGRHTHTERAALAVLPPPYFANLATRPFGPTAQPSPVGAKATLL